MHDEGKDTNAGDLRRLGHEGSVDRKVRASKRALFLNGAPSTGPLLLRFDVAVRAEAETLVLRLAPETTLHSGPLRRRHSFTAVLAC